MKKQLMPILLAFLLCFAFGCQDKEAMAALDKFKAQSEVEEQNKDIVKRWISELDKGNIAVVDEVIAEDFKTYYGEATFGRERLRGMCEAFSKSFSDSVHIIDDLVAEKDKVIVRLTVKVTNTGEFMGKAPTGKTVEYNGYTLYRIEAGKIQEIWMDHNATMELMLKLGLDLKPKEGEK